MYPRNAVSPERIAVGQVVLIADGTVQSTGVAITVRGQGAAEAAGAGTIAYGADNTVYYTPTQAETNYTSFVVIAYKASCFSASQTIITTASVTPGQVRLEGVTHTDAVIPTVSTLTGYTAASLVDAIYDENIITHLNANSAGLYIALAGGIIVDTTLVGTPTATSIQFTGGSTVANFYSDQMAEIISGTGALQSRPILSSSYDSGTTTLNFDENLVVVPASGDRLVIKFTHVHPLSTITNHVDANSTQLTAIKSKTDQMTFTKANEIDSNVQSINNVTIVGDGSATPFNV